jgi:hypothetical protein
VFSPPVVVWWVVVRFQMVESKLDRGSTGWTVGVLKLLPLLGLKKYVHLIWKFAWAPLPVVFRAIFGGSIFTGIPQKGKYLFAVKGGDRFRKHR